MLLVWPPTLTLKSKKALCKYFIPSLKFANYETFLPKISGPVDFQSKDFFLWKVTTASKSLIETQKKKRNLLFSKPGAN